MKGFRSNEELSKFFISRLKIERFVIFDPPKGGGVIFSTFLTPSHALKKVGLKCGGGGG